ncbi:MAG: glycosyltransferase [Actinomycetota bacterium]
MEDTLSLPASRYFMVLWALPTEFGGMTAMSLHRARAMHDYAGVDAGVITFEPKASYAGTLSVLRERNKISPATKVLNIYQYYRAAALEGRIPVTDMQDPPSDSGSHGYSFSVTDPAGRTFMTEAKRPDGQTSAWRKFYREDGSEFLRDEKPLDGQGESAGRYLTLFDRQGEPIQRWRSAGDFYRSWLRELTEGELSTLVVDSAFTSTIVAPLEADNVVKLIVMHNSHVAAGQDPFQGKLGTGRRTIVDETGSWDGIVFLTHRNQRDFEDRFGRSNNLFTISNPSGRAEHLPPFWNRLPKRGVMVCRLEPQKNVAEALNIMAVVHQSLPDCTLDIYGTGSLRADLQAQTVALGLQGVVKFHGHSTAAAGEFEQARFSLLTSRNEGQGLVLLESMGRGCPPVSYDIRYGPSDVIDDTETGYLIQPGDVEAAARRIVQLCTDDDLAQRMGELAWERSEKFSDAAVLQRWADVLSRVWAQKQERIVLRDLDLTLKEVCYNATGDVDIRANVTWRQLSGPPAEEALAANIVVGRRSAGAPTFFPAEIIRREEGKLEVLCTVTAAMLCDGVPDANHELDISLQVCGKNILRTFRVGFPGQTRWLPYATIHGSLSLKHV